MKTLLFSIAMTIVSTISVNAQTTAAVNQTATLTLKNSITLDLTSATGNNFNFENVGNYSNGLTNTNASAFQVKSNRPWAVTVKTTTANFNGPSAPSATMPSTVLGVRINGGTNFVPLSTTSKPVTNGNRGMASFSVDYNAAPGFIYDAGIYTIAVVYTATQQ